MEEDIIQPVSKALLKSELTADRLLRTTNKSHNNIYVVTAKNSPNVMREIGRLREIAFRTSGGGTGKSMDIDEFSPFFRSPGVIECLPWNGFANDYSEVLVSVSIHLINQEKHSKIDLGMKDLANFGDSIKTF